MFGSTQAFKNAMKIAKAGAMDAFLEILPQRAKTLPILPSLCLTLKSLAVNVSNLCLQLFVIFDNFRTTTIFCV
jgi:hypothetical protein